MTLLLIYVGFALAVSFVCSLLEATLLSAGRGMLSEEKAAGRRGAALLLHLKQERIDDSISAILILNTMANTLGATLAGAQAARVFGSSVIGVFSGVLTLLILVVSEIIPKTLGALHSRRLAGLVGHTLNALTWVMTPALAVSRLLTGLLAPSQPAKVSKGELVAVIAAAAREGALNITQTKLFESLLRFDEIKVTDVMTPRPMVVMMKAEASVAELLGHAEADAFSRVPLYAGDRIDDVVGYVLQREVLKAVAAGGGHERPLSTFRRPVTLVPATLSASAALSQLIERREAIAVVVDEHGGMDGVVTLEDLTETLLGVEIVDESDRVVDLRQAALEHRDRRLERLRQRLSRPEQQA